jgi:hypothetical protein
MSTNTGSGKSGIAQAAVEQGADRLLKSRHAGTTQTAQGPLKKTSSTFCGIIGTARGSTGNHNRHVKGLQNRYI